VETVLGLVVVGGEEMGLVVVDVVEMVWGLVVVGIEEMGLGWGEVGVGCKAGFDGEPENFSSAIGIEVSHAFLR